MAVILSLTSAAFSDTDATAPVAHEAEAFQMEEGAAAISGESATELFHSETGAPVAATSDAKLPQLDFATFPSQIFWLVVIFTALYIILQRSLLPKVHAVLENRANRIQQDLDRAEQYQHQAKEASASFEKAQAEARLHAQTVMEDVQKRAKAIIMQQQQEMDAKLRTQLSEADSGIEAARVDAMKQADAASSTLANAIVKRILSLGADDAASAAPIRRAQ
jgi:F-type H+-transporting ATPase subunit b